MKIQLFAMVLCSAGAYTNAQYVDAYAGSLVYQTVKLRLDYLTQYYTRSKKIFCFTMTLVESSLALANKPERYISKKSFVDLWDVIKRFEQKAGMKNMGDVMLPVVKVKEKEIDDYFIQATISLVADYERMGI